MYELKNCTEVIVTRIADRLLPESNICRCEKCRLDVIALALNLLPSRYVVSEKGALLAESELLALQKSTDYLSVVLSAIRQVELTPRHTM